MIFCFFMQFMEIINIYTIIIFFDSLPHNFYFFNLFVNHVY
ncbi:putative membrane protein [Synechococcus sp. A18-40]|nr:putative membrane protein [Synechococcus sp. A18-40]